MNKLGSNIYVIPKDEQYLDKSKLSSRRSSSLLYGGLLEESDLASNLKRELMTMKEKYEQSLLEITELKTKAHPGNIVNMEEILQQNQKKYDDKIKIYTQKIELLERKNQDLSTSIQTLKTDITNSKMNEERAIKKLRENELRLTNETSSILKEYHRKLEHEQKQFIEREKTITSNFLSKISSIQKENDELKMMVQNAKNDDQIEVLEKKLIENERAHQREVSQLESDLRSVNLKYQETLVELRVSESKLIANEKLVSNAKIDLEKQQKAIEDFYKEKDSLSSQLRLKEVAIQNLTNTLNDALTDKMLRDERNADMNEDLKQKELQIQKLQQEILTLEMEINDKNNKDFMDSIIKQERKRENEQASALLLSEKEKQLLELKKAIEKSRNDYIRKDDELNKMFIELREAKNVIATLQTELNNVNIYNRQIINENEQLSLNTTKYLDELSEKQSLIEQLKIKLEDTNTQNRSQIISKIYELEARISELTTYKLTSEQDIQNKIREINLLKGRIESQKQLENELNTYKTKVKANNDIVENLQSQLERLRRDNEGLQRQTNQLLENQFINQNDKNQIIALYESVLADSNSLRIANASLSQQNVVLSNSVSNLYEQINYVNFAVTEKDQIINHLNELQRNVQRQYTIVNEEVAKEKQIKMNEEDIMQKLHNFADTLYTAFDAFIVITDSHILNGNHFIKKYVSPFLTFVKAFENQEEIYVNFQVEKKGVVQSVKNIVSKLISAIVGKKSASREHSFYQQTTRAFSHNFSSQYNSMITVLKVFKDNPIPFPTFDEVKNAHKTIYGKITQFNENLEKYLKQVTTNVAINSIEIIIEHNKRLGLAIDRMQQLINLNTDLMTSYETIIPTVIKSFEYIDDVKSTRTLIDHSSLIQFCSPTINNIGKLGCELLMYIKNLCIELNDKGYGNNRNQLKLDKDVLMVCHEYLGNLLSNELMNRTSPISYLYDLRLIFARTLILRLMGWNETTFFLNRDPIDAIEFEVIWNTFSSPSEKNKNMTPLLLNSTQVYFDSEAKEVMYYNLSNLSANYGRDIYFFFLSTILERIIIKFEQYSNRRIYIQHIDTKGYIYEAATELKNYFSDYDLGTNLQPSDINVFIQFRELIETFISSLCETSHYMDPEAETPKETSDPNVLPFITKATESTYKPRGFLDGPKEVVTKIVNRTREKASTIVKKVKSSLQNLNVPNLSTIYYEWKDKGKRAIQKGVSIAKTVGQKAKEAFKTVKNWVSNLFCRKRHYAGGAERINVVDAKPHDKFDQDDLQKNMAILVDEEREEYHINLMPQEELEKRLSVGLNYERDQYVDETYDVDDLGEKIIPKKLQERVTEKKPKLLPDMGTPLEVTPIDFSKEYYKNIKLEIIGKQLEPVKEMRQKPNAIIMPTIPLGTPNYNTGIILDDVLNLPQIALGY